MGRAQEPGRRGPRRYEGPAVSTADLLLPLLLLLLITCIILTIRAAQRSASCRVASAARGLGDSSLDAFCARGCTKYLSKHNKQTLILNKLVICIYIYILFSFVFLIIIIVIIVYIHIYTYSIFSLYIYIPFSLSLYLSLSLYTYIYIYILQCTSPCLVAGADSCSSVRGSTMTSNW